MKQPELPVQKRVDFSSSSAKYSLVLYAGFVGDEVEVGVEIRLTRSIGLVVFGS